MDIVFLNFKTHFVAEFPPIYGATAIPTRASGTLAMQVDTSKRSCRNKATSAFCWGSNGIYNGNPWDYNRITVSNGIHHENSMVYWDSKGIYGNP